MGSIRKATRPNEVVCIIAIELNTIKDGKGYMFVIMDAYSEFIFHAGVERGDGLEHVTNQIRQFLSNKDFSKHKSQPFTLVMSGFEEYRKEIEKIIEPHNGTMVVDGAYIKKQLTPAIGRFLATVAKNHN